MRRWLITLSLLTLLLLPMPVQAQNEIVFDSMSVEIWPEYDQPSVLVIYRIQLSPDVKLPADLELRIPRAAGAPAAVAEQTANGLFNLNATTTGQDDTWIRYQFTTTLPQVQFEYYDPGLVKEGSERSYIFNWPGDYAVTNMTVSVQEPRTASNLRLQPDIGSSTRGTDGFTYFNVPIGKVPQAEQFKITINYTKSDDELSQQQTFTEVTPAAPSSQAVAGSPTLAQAIPWIIGGLGVLLIVAGALWYTRTGRGQTTSSAQPRHRPVQVNLAEPKENGDKIFCHNCGKRAGSGDVFCRACGTKIRR